MKSRGSALRALTTSLSLWVLPTTGEYGPRGGFVDYERHEQLATRFGASYTHSSENRFSQASVLAPDNTQIRISDSLLLFEKGALADGVTVLNARYDLLALDAGAKFKGWNFAAEFYHRWLSAFEADGPVPLKQIIDQGLYAQLGYVLPHRWLAPYVGTSYIWGQFNNSYEIVGGLDVYPFRTRNFRINGQFIYVRRSSQSSVFGYYVGGQTGPTLSVAADVFF